MKKKILIVDDEKVIIKFLCHVFSSKNYQIDSAGNGEDALEKINKEIPDLILSDIMMPQMDGFDFYAKLKENPKTAEIPFIFLSGKQDANDQLKGLRMGAKEYFTKPVDVKHLNTTVETVLANAEKANFSKERIDFSGNLAEMNLEDIVQIIEMNQKTGELVFTTYEDSPIGSVYFQDGGMINASTRALEGEEAFYDLTANIEGYAKFYSREIAVAKIISGNIMSMLLETARLQDESKTLYSMIENMDAPLRIITHRIPAELDDSLESELIKRILKMIEQKQTVREIINSGEMSRLRAEHILLELVNARIVKFEEAELIMRLKEIESSKLTGVMKIEGRSRESIIHFHEGRVDQAYRGNVTGEKALFRIFSEKGGKIDFKPQRIIIEGAIEKDLETLLDEGRHEKEWKQDLDDAILDSQVILRPGAYEKAAESDRYPNLADTLRNVEENKWVRDILDASRQADLNTFKQILYMEKNGIITLQKKVEYFTLLY